MASFNKLTLLRRGKSLHGLSGRSFSSADAESRADHIATSKRKLEKKRFYEKAHMRPAGSGVGYEVLLDHRVLRTPAKKPLLLPNPALALALAAEWEWQESSGGIRSFTMPLFRLASISIDQIPVDKEKIIASLLKYCHTDALCCRAEAGSTLSEKQAKAWNPLLDWAEQSLGARLTVSSSILGMNQPVHVLYALEKALRSLNDWELAAVDSLASASRSLVVAWAILRQHLTIEEAIQVIRLEEDHQVFCDGLDLGITSCAIKEWLCILALDHATQKSDALECERRHLAVANTYPLLVSESDPVLGESLHCLSVQIEEWGLVEGGHDIDVADLRVRISSASVFLRLLSIGGGGKI